MSRATVFLTFCFASMPCVVLPGEVSGQEPSRLGLQAVRLSPLSDEIEEMRRSPFHRDPVDVSADSRFLMSTISPVWLNQAPPTDRTVSGTKVFLVTTGAAVVSDLVGFVMLLCWDYGGSLGCLDSNELSLLGGITIPVLGTAAGAKLAGARLGPALIGSTLGLGMALFAAVAIDPDSFLFFPILSLVHAGVTTMFSTAFR